MLNFFEIIYKHSDRTSQETQYISAAKIDRLMLFRDKNRCGDRNISIDWAQLSRFHQKTETESSFRNVCFR
jgi:hypothetical protein